jgi:hypothetical protein
MVRDETGADIPDRQKWSGELPTVKRLVSKRRAILRRQQTDKL